VERGDEAKPIVDAKPTAALSSGAGSGSKQMNKTITISNGEGSSLSFDDNNYDLEDKELFESDEILQILFKKTFYYQKKIR
jgi:hypothetical protein